MCRQFTGPLLYTSLELWNAARTDPQVAQADRPREVRHPAGGQAALIGLELTWQFMRGTALTMILRHDSASQDALIAE